MISFYCPRCTKLFGRVEFRGKYHIRLCHTCSATIGIPDAPPSPRDQPDAPREDIDAPLAHDTDVAAGTGRDNTLHTTQPDPPPDPMRLRAAHTDPAAAAPPATAP